MDDRPKMCDYDKLKLLLQVVITCEEPDRMEEVEKRIGMMYLFHYFLFFVANKIVFLLFGI